MAEDTQPVSGNDSVGLVDGLKETFVDVSGLWLRRQLGLDSTQNPITAQVPPPDQSLTGRDQGPGISTQTIWIAAGVAGVLVVGAIAFAIMRKG